MAELKDKDKKADKLGVAVDLDDKSLPSGVKSKLDPTEDVWEIPAPPPAGRYDLKLAMASGKTAPIELWPIDEKKKAEGDNVYYLLNLECDVMKDGEYVGSKVFPRLSTRLGRGKQLSTAAWMIGFLGYKVPAEANDLMIVKLLVKIIKEKEPVAKDVLLDWQGYLSAGNESRVVFPSYNDFPDDGNGGKEHIVTVTLKDKTKAEVKANLRVKEWGKKKEEKSKSNSSPKKKDEEPVQEATEDDVNALLEGL